MQLRVREMRKQRGMPQVELAEKVGVAQGYISDIENGNGTPSLEVFEKLANALECTFDELAGRNTIVPESE